MRVDLTGVDGLGHHLATRCCVGDVPTRGAQHFPDRIAVVDAAAGVELTYAELERRANRLARGLRTLGLAHQEPVGIMIRNSWEFLVAFFACAKTGYVALPVTLALDPDQMAYVLDHAEVRVVLTETAFAPHLARILPQVARIERVFATDVHAPTDGDVPLEPFAGLFDADDSTVTVEVGERDVVHCLYTSGTTSLPKGVLTSHLAVMMAVLSFCLQHGMRRGTGGRTQVVVLPLYHTTALDVLTMPMLVTGGTVVLLDGFEVRATMDALEHHRAESILLLPRMWADILEQPDARDRDFTALRRALYAMAPMPPERLARIREVFGNADVVLGSGQTEFTPPTVWQYPEHQHTKSSSWGSAVATTEVGIMAPDGRLLPRGEEGEIVYRGPQCMAGYWRNAEANRTAFAHGWFHSGDIGWLDDEGVVWFTDRVKDIVKTGGENVSSVEVERTLLGHDAVADAAVVGLPHDRWGEAVTAFVVPVDGAVADEAALIAFCRERLAGFQIPKRIVAVEDFPRTGTGKIQKHELRGAHRALYEG